MPKLSVIIPAHNEANYIRKGLESIKQQSFTDYEIIVVCDDCTDNTEQVALEYTDKVYKVNYHKSGLTRNVGIDNAEGDYILFMDADDWYLHEFAFEQLAEKLNEYDPDLLIFSIIWRHIGYGPVRSVKGTIFPHSANKCWRRSIIGDTRFSDIEVAEDGDFFNRMMDKYLTIFEWDMPLYYYNYLSDGSKSVQLGRTVECTKQYWSTH